MQKLKSAFQIIVESLTSFLNDNGTLLGAGISFYALFSLAPLLIFGVALIGLFLGDEAAQGLIVEQFGAYVGNDVAGVIEDAIVATNQSGGGVLATVIGFTVVIYGGHNIFVQVRRALNIIAGDPPEDEQPGALKAFALERGLSLLALLILGAFFVALALVTLLMRVVVRNFGDVIPLWDYLATPVDFLITFLAVTGIVAVTYRILPTKNLLWRKTLPGAALVGVAFFAEKWLLGIYLSYASVESAYGAAGSLVAFMMWVFFTSLAYLFGAEFNHVLAERSNTRDHVEDKN